MADKDSYSNKVKMLVYGVAKRHAIRPRNSVEALEVCKVLFRHNISCTVGKLSKLGDDPAPIVDEYQFTSNSVRNGTAANAFYLSVKPPALNFNPEYAGKIIATARQNGHGVHFDAHAFEHTDATLKLLDQMMEIYPPCGTEPGWRFGLTLPSRWKRTLEDARWVARKGVRPRVVKGDFRAGSCDETDPVKGFRALIDLLAGEVAELAVATHDCELARDAVLRCREKGSAVQLELLFGMASTGIMAVARELEVPVRFYVPFGDYLLLYAIWDLLTNPRKALRRHSLELLGSQEAKLARIIGAL